MHIPFVKIIFMPYLFYYWQSQYLRIMPIECSFPYEVLSPRVYIVLEELDQSIVEPILFEDHSTSKVELNESNESWVMDFEVHCFKDSSFSLLVLFLAKGFLCVSLISIEVRDIFIKLNCLSSHNQCCTCPEFLTSIQMAEKLVDIESEGQGFSCEHKFIADGAQ